MSVKEESLEIRIYVLHQSLTIENIVSVALARLIGIETPLNSYCFGNSSKALSFNQKIFLLIDIGALDDSTKTKFIKFMEIRNQFIHNANANSYKECLNYIDGAEKYLLKNYSEQGDTEMHLQLAFNKLIKDVLKSVEQIIDKLSEKFDQITDDRGTKILFEYCKNNDKSVLEALNKTFDGLALIGKNEDEASKMKNFGEFIEALPELKRVVTEILGKNINVNVKDSIAQAYENL